MLYKTLMERKGPKTLKKNLFGEEFDLHQTEKGKEEDEENDHSTEEEVVTIAIKTRRRGWRRKRKRRDETRDDLDVIFRYFYKEVADLRVSEKTERSYRSRCPFCFIKPRNFVGLCQHLNASHDQFYFTFLPVTRYSKG